mmetsp:Transcript_9659/g.33332  ORF Transcript_9659/g.33332 Transcript_9659/m.33332 type:complete len:192 (+) Transcript_9659:1060-1635(+)
MRSLSRWAAASPETLERADLADAPSSSSHPWSCCCTARAYRCSAAATTSRAASSAARAASTSWSRSAAEPPLLLLLPSPLLLLLLLPLAVVAAAAEDRRGVSLPAVHLLRAVFRPLRLPPAVIDRGRVATVAALPSPLVALHLFPELRSVLDLLVLPSAVSLADSGERRRVLLVRRVAALPPPPVAGHLLL